MRIVNRITERSEGGGDDLDVKFCGVGFERDRIDGSLETVNLLGLYLLRRLPRSWPEAECRVGSVSCDLHPRSTLQRIKQCFASSLRVSRVPRMIGDEAN